MLDKFELEKNRKKIIAELTNTKRAGIENLIGWFESSNFFTSPASTMFHGNYEGGLALHSYEVYKAFFRRVNEYSLHIRDSSALITGICHDCCKIDLYISYKLKSGNISEAKPYKTNEVFPLGHGEKSVFLASRYIELTSSEAMMMRWHRGYEDPAWKDLKEKVELQFPEVVLFQHADKEVSLIKKI